MHTSVPEAFKGMGIGTALVMAALSFANEQGQKLKLYCPFALQFIKGRPEYHHLVDIHHSPGF